MNEYTENATVTIPYKQFIEMEERLVQLELISDEVQSAVGKALEREIREKDCLDFLSSLFA